MTRSAMKSLALAVGLALGASGTAAAKEKIVIGELNWDGARAIQAIMKVVMEERLDVDVEFTAADQAVMFAAMDKGDGGIDVHPDIWIPAQAAQLAKFANPGSAETVLINDAPYQGAEGFYIPGYIQDEHGVKSVEDLKRPEIAKLFDTDGNGKGEYWPGAPGWGVTNAYVVKAKSYGFDGLFDALEISDAVLKAQLKTAFRKKQGILFYYWAPEWIHADYDLRLLEEPAFDGYAMDSKKDDPLFKADGCWNMYQPEEADDWLEKSEVRCASAPATIYVGYAKTLVERAPKVAQFLKQVAFDPADINALILQIGRDKEDPAEAAQAWVKANGSKVDAWLAGI